MHSNNTTNYDHRDVIIQRLQQDIEEMRKNEQDYSDLNFLLTNLEHRYNLLNEEKIRNENDFTLRQEDNLKLIADLQCSLDNHKQLLSQRDQEIEEACIQLSAMKDLEKHREQDLEQMRQELYDLSSAYNNLKEDNIFLESQAKKLEDEKIFVEKEIEKLNQLVEETYEKHLNLGKENQELLDKVQSFSKEGEFYKGEAMKKSNELREIQFNFENERENMLNEMKNIELTYKEKFDYQRKEFKEFEERLYEESEHKQQNLSDALEKEKSNYEEKTLEFANSNKEMLKQLEKVFENEEILREKVENKRKIKDQTILQEKSIRIALKELQEELMIGRTTGYVSKTNELLKNSISKRNKTKMND